MGTPANFGSIRFALRHSPCVSWISSLELPNPPSTFQHSSAEPLYACSETTSFACGPDASSQVRFRFRLLSMASHGPAVTRRDPQYVSLLAAPGAAVLAARAAGMLAAPIMTAEIVAARNAQNR